jgi:hypothetical protein
MLYIIWLYFMYPGKETLKPFNNPKSLLNMPHAESSHLGWIEPRSPFLSFWWKTFNVLIKGRHEEKPSTPARLRLCVRTLLLFTTYWPMKYVIDFQPAIYTLTDNAISEGHFYRIGDLMKDIKHAFSALRIRHRHPMTSERVIAA